MKIENTTFYNELAALLRCLKSTCSSCMRRCPVLCQQCDIRNAPKLLEELERTGGVMRKEVEASTYGERAQRIYEELKKAGRPLMSSEINIDDVCAYKQLKYGTLKSMARNGVLSIGMNKARTHFVYALRNQEEGEAEK